MKTTVLFPGTFDPFTIGHLSIVSRALNNFDHVVVAIGNNMMKRPFFSIEKRIEMCKEIFKDEPRVSVEYYNCLTADFAKQIGANAILRGIRTVADFEYERSVADANRHMTGIDTILLFTETQYSFVSSSVVRDLLLYKKVEAVRHYLPKNIDIEKYM